MKIERIAVFISGSGTTLNALIQAQEAGKFGDAEIALVVSSNVGAPGIFNYAQPAGIPHSIIIKDNFENDEEYGKVILKILKRENIDFICLAGFLKKIPANVVNEFRGRIINSHPGDTKKYGGEKMYGLRVHQAVLAAGEKKTCSTIHFADEEYDRGPIILQEWMDIPKRITAKKLQEKLLPIEWHNYVEALKLLLTDKF